MSRTTEPLDLTGLLSGRSMLLMGGTGFLGKVFLTMLLDRFPDIAHIYLVVRPRKRKDGSIRQTSEERFWAEIIPSPTFDPIRASLPGTQFEDFVKAKLTPIAGDVSEPFAGVPEETREAIRGKVDMLVNAAGVVDFQPPLDYALNANAFGMENLVALARDLGGIKFFHTSTCYVAGDRTGQVDELHPMTWPFPKADELDVSHWDSAREIAECVDMVEHVRHRAADAFRQSEFLDRAKQNLIDKGEPARGSALKDELDKVKRRFVEDKLRDDGTERAKFWGWHNTYTYTKSIGEQILCNSGLDFCIGRPAVIESAVTWPEEGWCEGINTSTPLIYLGIEGPAAYPARKESVLDIVPVDMVAAGMLVSIGELLEGTNHPVYQYGTSDTNPLKMYRFIELIGLYKRRHYKAGVKNPFVDFVQARIEPRPTTVAAYHSRGPKKLSQWLGKGASVLKSVGGPLAGPAGNTLKGVSKSFDIQSKIIDQFIPFMATHNYRFSCENTRAAWSRLEPELRDRIPWIPETIDWRHYIVDTHAAGIQRHAVPVIEERLNKPARALRRHDTLLDLLDEIHERHDLAPALLRTHDDGFTRMSFRELQQLSDCAAVTLRSAGVTVGSRVLISGLNHPDWAVCYFGILKAGAVAVPLDPALEGPQVANIAGTADPAAAILDPEAVMNFGAVLEVPILDLNDTAARVDTSGFERHAVAPTDIASILFTSGTTGEPKGVMLSHANFCSLLASLGKVFPLKPHDRVLSVLPLHHTFEFSCGLLLPLSRGARVVYLDEINGERLAYGLKGQKITAMVGVPALWQLLERRIRSQVKERGKVAETVFDAGLALNQMLGRTTGLDMGRIFFGQVHDQLGGNVRYLISGAAALPKETQSLFQGLGLHLAEGYGLTESAPVLTVAKGKPGSKAGHVGKPVPGVEIKIDKPDKEGIGEVIARGPNVMQGYFGNEEATKGVLKDGWLHTGDLGKMDHAGRLTIMGRAKEVVVTASGENIYLDDVENLLGPNLPFVSEYSMVGILDPRGGERLGMLAVPNTEDNPDLDRRTLHAKAKASIAKELKRLSGYQKPSVIHLVDAELPRTASRKVKRKEVRKVLEKIAEAAPSKTSKSGVAGPVAEAIAKVAGVDISKVGVGTQMAAELGFDSLMWVELASAVDSIGGGVPDADALAACETVQDVVDMVKAPRAPVVVEEDVRDKVRIPELIAGPAKAGLGFLQRELYGTGLDTRVVGRAYIPQNRQTIVVSNHCSHLDMGLVKYALGQYGFKLVALAAKDYFFEGNPYLVAYFEQLTNLEAIDRKKGFRASLNQAIHVVKRGDVVLLFPEGTRRPDGTIGEFKPLIGRLALETGVDILPLHLGGTFEAMPKGAVLPRRRDVTVTIGPPLKMSDLRRLTAGKKPSKAAREVSALAQRAVEALRDGEVLDLSRIEGEVKIEKKATIEDAFASLPKRFASERFDKPMSWYFSLGGKEGARYTVEVSKDKATVSPGRPAGSADCVVKTSEEMMRKIIMDAYTPEAPEFFSGVIKTNEIPLLLEFARVFALAG